MKRDLDLIRKILLAVEAHPHGLAPDDLTIPGYTDEQVGHHNWLIVRSGLADGAETTSHQSESRSALIYSLTPAGHDFLDAARDDTTWKRVTAAAGAVTIDVLTTALKEFAARLLRERLGLPPSG